MVNVSGRVSVAVRVRPPTPAESGSQIAIETKDEANKIIVHHKEEPDAREFALDAVIGPTKTQEHVYREIGQPILDSVMCGYNGTIFAYGQTGSGKTYTLLNLSSDLSTAGLIPRLVAALYVSIANDIGHVYTVKVSMLQIYNENCDDLLRPANLNLPLRESKESGVYVDGLSWYTSPTPEFMLQCLNRGRDNIVYAETKMNKHSSRSHAVFQIFVTRRKRHQTAVTDTDETDGTVTATCTIGKLTLIDLAGSERIKKSGAVGQRLVEAQRINSSLLALGNVISALAEGRPEGHIPYRDSKLTRLLQDRLGGTCKTTLLVCVSPVAANTGESVRTLEFGSRAMRVKVDAQINTGTLQLDAKTLAQDLAEEYKMRAAMAASGEVLSLRDSLAKQEDEYRRAREEFERQLMVIEGKLQENEQQRETMLAEREERERALRLNLQRKGTELGHAAQKVKSLKEQLHTTEDSLKQRDARIMELIAESEEKSNVMQAQFQKQLDDMIVAQDSLKEALEMARNEHTKAQENSEVEKQKNAFTAQIVKLETELAESKARHEQALEEIKVGEQKLADNTDATEALRKEMNEKIAALEAKMDEERREHQLAMESKEAELVEALRIQHERSQELVQLYKLHAEIEERKNELESKVAATSSELEATRLRRAEEQAKYDALLADKDRQLTEEEIKHREALEMLMSQLDEKEKSLQEQLQEYEAERDKLRKQLDQVSQQRDEEEERHARSRELYEKQAAEQAAAQTAARKQYEAEIGALKEQLDEIRHDADYRQSGLQLVLKQKQDQINQLTMQQALFAANQDLERRLASGAVFVKHGRTGRPHRRYIRIVNDRMEWSDVKATAEGFIRLSEVTEVAEGITTSVARRTGDRSRSNCFFSLVTPTRTLDLECNTPTERDEWVQLLRALVTSRQQATPTVPPPGTPAPLHSHMSASFAPIQLPHTAPLPSAPVTGTPPRVSMSIGTANSLSPR